MLYFVATFLMLAGAAVAGPLEDARAAYERDDYATAVRLWRQLAEQGDVLAQFNLGVMYHYGQGLPQDNAEAVNWHRKAADQGDLGAQLELGGMYYDGQGVPQDYAEAAKWYRKAANQGNAAAQARLGGAYANGHGGRRNTITGPFLIVGQVAHSK
jgi:uncharacterized protein